MKGFEVELSRRVEEKYSTSVGYTYLDAQDRSEGRFNDFLAYKIKHSINFSLSYELDKLTFSVQTRFRSAIKEVFIYPGSEPGPYWLWNGKISYQLNNQIQSYIALDNVTNTLYEELERYRMPGRSYTLGLRWGF